MLIPPPPPLLSFFLLQEGPIKIVEYPKVHMGSRWTHFLEVPKQNHQDLRRDFWQCPTGFELFGPSEILKEKRNRWFYFTKLSVITVHHQQHTRRRKEGKLISYVYSIQLKSWEIYRFMRLLIASGIRWW